MKRITQEQAKIDQGGHSDAGKAVTDALGISIPVPAADAPLWRHMQYAAMTCSKYPDAAACTAAELRAIEVFLKPLESYGGARKMAYLLIRNLIAAEASRAELEARSL